MHYKFSAICQMQALSSFLNYLFAFTDQPPIQISFAFVWKELRQTKKGHSFAIRRRGIRSTAECRAVFPVRLAVQSAASQ